MTFDYSNISNIRVDDIDFRDAPDYVDAYISSCDYNGEPMTEEQLTFLNEDRDFVYDCTLSQLY